MPLVTDPNQIKEIYDQAAEQGVCMANFCTANMRTTEAIIRAGHLYAEQNGLAPLPMVVSVTGNYVVEPQLVHYTAAKDARLGLRAFLSDVETFMSEDSPYRDVQVMLHLDHAKPGYEDELVPRCLGKFATIMWDCSHYPIDENIARVARFVEETRGKVWVEGAVDEVVQAEDAGETHGDLTDPDLAERFMRETGVFLIVPNLGTEHRSTAATARYDGDRAREIKARVGTKMVLHGTSSMKESDLARLAGDGILKANMWSIFERIGGQAVGADLVENLGNMFPPARLREWQSAGFLGPRYLAEDYRTGQAGGVLGPKGAYLVEHRRRNLWVDAVVEVMTNFMGHLGYRNWQ
jgi:fructose/tagatose bisphosphate aldolase